MRQAVRKNLTQNLIACTNALNPLHDKWIAEMLLAKCHETVVALKQIGDDDITVVITIEVLNAQDRICFVLRQHRHDRWIFAKEQNASDRHSLDLPHIIAQNQSSAAQHRFIAHRAPRMIARTHTRHLSRTVDEICAQIIHLKARNFIDKITAALARVQLINHIHTVCNIDVRFMIAIKNSPAMPANLRTRWNLDDKQYVPRHLKCLWLQIKRRIKFFGVVDRCDKICLHVIDGFWRNTGDRSVVADTQQDHATVPVGKAHTVS